MLTRLEVQWLLDKLRIQAGFCPAPEQQQKLLADPPADPIAFTHAVFRAEGLRPELAEPHLYRVVHATVVNFWRKHGYEAHDGIPNKRRNEL
jgi:hypothetical protein